MKKGRGKNAMGEDRQTRSVRVYPSTKEKIEARFGSVQKFFDQKTKEVFGREAVEAVGTTDRDEISEDDF